MTMKTIKIKCKIYEILVKLLAEEGLELNDETILDAVLHKFGSVNSNHASQLKQLYNGNWDLRRTAAAVAESYYAHQKPAVEKLVPFIEWLADHLEGIPFDTTYDPYKSGDYDPTRPADFLDSLYTQFLAYDREGEAIDRLHEVNQNGFLTDVKRGEEHASQIITSHELYNLYKGGWFTEKAAKIKAKIEDPNLTPSDALRILAENWEWYVTPDIFKNMNRDIEYCIYCAADFPESDTARAEFRRIVKAIHD